MAHEVRQVDHHAGAGAAGHRADDEDQALALLDVLGALERGRLAVRLAIHPADRLDERLVDGVGVAQEESGAADRAALLRAAADVALGRAEHPVELLVLQPVHVRGGLAGADVGKDRIHRHAAGADDVLELGQAVALVKRGVELRAGKAVQVAQAVRVEREQDDPLGHLSVGFFQAFLQDGQRSLA
jgi:hypothetical protein